MCIFPDLRMFQSILMLSNFFSCRRKYIVFFLRKSENIVQESFSPIFNWNFTTWLKLCTIVFASVLLARKTDKIDTKKLIWFGTKNVGEINHRATKKRIQKPLCLQANRFQIWFRFIIFFLNWSIIRIFTLPTSIPNFIILFLKLKEFVEIKNENLILMFLVLSIYSRFRFHFIFQKLNSLV